jgi:hypothetical protein
LGGVKEEIRKEFADPGEWFIKEMASRVHSGTRVTSSIQDQFKPIVQEAILAFINEKVDARLKSAIEVGSQQDSEPKAEEINQEESIDSNGIETTAEETEGLYIVRAICASDVDPSRLTEKDTKTYFNILLDGNTWKSVARLYFNGATKKVEIFDDQEPKFVELSSVPDLYSSAERIRNSLKKRLG